MRKKINIETCTNTFCFWINRGMKSSSDLILRKNEQTHKDLIFLVNVHQVIFLGRLIKFFNYKIEKTIQIIKKHYVQLEVYGD